MSISCPGRPCKKIHYLDPETPTTWSDLALVASDGSTLMTSRLLLASTSDLFLDLFLSLEPITSDDDVSMVLTDFSLQELSTIHLFISTGYLQIPLSYDKSELEKLFLDFGIDLSRLDLVHDFSVKSDPSSNPDFFLDQTENEVDTSRDSKYPTSEDEAFGVSENANEIPPKSRLKRKRDDDDDDESDPEGGSKSSVLIKGVDKKPRLKPAKQCPHCQKTFGCAKYFKQHVLRHESADKTKKWFCLQCDDQNASFETEDQLKAHKTEAHADRTLTCPKCSKVFIGSTYQRYKKHLATHNKASSKTLDCVACGFKAKTQESLTRHKTNYGPYHDGKCTTCDLEFTTWDEHGRHVAKDHGGKFGFRCGLCPIVFDTVQRMRLHRKEDHFGKGDVSENQRKRRDLKSEQQQVCESCGKLVKSKYYEKHLINNHGSGEYPCPQCGKVVNHPQVLERHIKNFHNEFPCEQCGKTMRNQKKYNVHILSVHTPEHLKPYQCEICIPPKGFHTKTNLREHMNVHSNDRPHKCKFCGAGFNSAGNRFAHERSSHLGIKRKK